MTHRITFIDANIAEYASLVSQLPAGSEVIVLDSKHDGVLQILAALQGKTGLDAIDILSHGKPSTLLLGSIELNNATLTDYAEQLPEIGTHLRVGGDILIYGCDVAQGEAGKLFIDQLSTLTRADMAASNDLTGSALLGGDWQLETTTGKIESALPLNTSVLDSYTAILADDYTANTGTTGVVAVGGSVIGTVETVGDIDWFKTNLVAGKSYTITLEGSWSGQGTLPDPYFAGIYNSVGTFLGYANDDGSNASDGYNSRSTFTAPATGSYYFAASGSSATAANTGSYRLAVSTANIAPTFVMGDGTVTTDFGYSHGVGQSITMLVDGKILVAGYGGIFPDLNFILVRYNSNGSLDTSFDGDGKVITSITSYDDIGQSIALQPDGKILVTGYSDNIADNSFLLARYNSDGSLDTSFDGDGKVISNFSPNYDASHAVALQTDGKILVAGQSNHFALARYNSNGTLDSSFDGDGKVTTVIGSSSSGYSVALQTDGKILIAGDSHNGSNSDFALARYNSNGSLDSSFDGDGIATTAISSDNDYGRSVTVQADGKILVAGYSYNVSNWDFSLVRYNSNGSLDTSFDGDGKVTTAISSNDDYGRSVTVQADGKILVAGDSYNGSDFDFTIVRYNSNGSLDTSFDGDGKVTTAIGSFNDQSFSIIVQPDEKILVAGNSYVGSYSNVTIARYNPDGSLDGTFDIPSNTLNAKPNYTENGSAVVLDNTVQIYDLELATQGNYSGASITLARHGGANNQDIFSGSGNLSFVSENAMLSGVNIGTVSNSNGVLTLKYNSNATQALVDASLSALAYSNSSDAPPPSVQIDWAFSDGNTGAQGTDGALQATGITTVNITSVNDIPLLAHPLSTQTVNYGTVFSYMIPVDSFTDPDTGDTLNYTATLSNGAVLPAWLSFNSTTQSFSGTPGVNDIGSSVVSVKATDNAGTSASGKFTLTVTAAPTLTAFSAPITTASEDTEVQITFSQLQTQGNEADIDGTVTAFVAKAISAGTLRIGSDATTATAWDAINNNTIDTNNNAYWMPASNTNGTLDAFTVTAKDNSGLESSLPIQATVNITPVNDSPFLNTPVAIDYTDTAFDDTFANANGLLSANDIDGDALTYGILGGTDNGLTISQSSLYGVLTITKSTGAYIFVANDTAIEPLTFSVSDSFTVTVSDGLLSDSKMLTINIAQSGVTESIGNDTLTGTAGNDKFDGLAGADTMIGGLGNDSYVVDTASDIIAENLNEGTDSVASSVTYTLPSNVENLTSTGALAINGTGNSLANIITGNAANNTLNGSTGADSLIGGLGNDTYTVDNIGDVVTENLNEGTDKINSSVTYTLPVNVENLTLTGSSIINGTGNDLANNLIGNTASNVLTGGAGKDTLDGKAGADTLFGGLDNDTYTVDNTGDVVTENLGEGTDKINSSVTYTLPANVENLTLTGSAIIDGTGNNLANTLIGNTAANQLDGGSGNDTLDGGLGNNVLTGGTGKDSFKFTTVGHIDTITDYNVVDDTIKLENAVFTALSTTGTIPAGQFKVGANAADADDYIIYNNITGALLYDADGSGLGAAVQIATLTGGLAMTNADIVVI